MLDWSKVRRAEVQCSEDVVIAALFDGTPGNCVEVVILSRKGGESLRDRLTEALATRQ